jgi:ABC-type nitrate/sulfonate/bicarbonate transport system ATPase subunit
MVEIRLIGLGKSFGSNKQRNNVLQDLDLDVSKGEVIALRGDNGSGKTTLLNIIAGIEASTEGEISFNTLDMRRPRIGYVQQDYTSSLLPWFNVLENITIPLRLEGIAKSQRHQRADDLLSSLRFDNLPKDAYPHQLSGGQKQKIAVARALIHEPHLLLLDEPFANLDAHTGRELQETLSRIHQSRYPTMLYVSHELDHCIYLADRILLLHGHPSRIIDQFKVDLPRPRTREMIFSQAYVKIRSLILAKEEELYAKGR